MYSKVLNNHKMVLILLVLFSISMIKPAYSSNVGWTSFTSTSSGKTIAIYSNNTLYFIKVTIDITSGGSPTATQLDYGSNSITVGSSGGTYVIKAKSVNLVITGAESGQFIVTPLSVDDQAFYTLGIAKVFVAYFLIPLFSVLLLMAVIYFTWRTRP